MNCNNSLKITISKYLIHLIKAKEEFNNYLHKIVNGLTHIPFHKIIM